MCSDVCIIYLRYIHCKTLNQGHPAGLFCPTRLKKDPLSMGEVVPGIPGESFFYLKTLEDLRTRYPSSKWCLKGFCLHASQDENQVQQHEQVWRLCSVAEINSRVCHRNDLFCTEKSGLVHVLVGAHALLALVFFWDLCRSSHVKKKPNKKNLKAKSVFLNTPVFFRLLALRAPALLCSWTQPGCELRKVKAEPSVCDGAPNPWLSDNQS